MNGLLISYNVLSQLTICPLFGGAQFDSVFFAALAAIEFSPAF